MYELINNVQIKIKEYKGYRVVTFKDIDMVHGRPNGTARKRFNDNRKRFIEGEDYFVRNSDEAKKEFGIIAPNGLILLTESGYLMLVKSFTDDLSWSVQRQFVKTYFKVSEITASYNDTAIIKKLELLEQKINVLDKKIDSHIKNSEIRADNIMKTLFDISSNVIFTGFEFLYNNFFGE